MATEKHNDHKESATIAAKYTLFMAAFKFKHNMYIPKNRHNANIKLKIMEKISGIAIMPPKIRYAFHIIAYNTINEYKNLKLIIK